MVITSPFTLMIMLGLAMPATFLVAKPTPTVRKRKQCQAYISLMSLSKSENCGVCVWKRRKTPVSFLKPHLNSFCWLSIEGLLLKEKFWGRVDVGLFFELPLL
jgi:hypothetical protein